MGSISRLTVYGFLVPPCANSRPRLLRALITAGCSFLLAGGRRPTQPRLKEGGNRGMNVLSQVQGDTRAFNDDDSTAYDAELAGRLQLLRTRYDPCPRCMSAGPGQVSVDFEIETGAHLQMTPRLLAMRGGFSLSSQNAVHLPSLSEHTFVDIDGIGVKMRGARNTGYHQGLFAQVELGTMPVRPREVPALIIPPIQDYIQKLRRRRRGGRRVLLPLASDIRFTGAHNLFHSCRGRRPCHMHWTVGLQLSQVPRLLQLNPLSRAASVVNATRRMCGARVGECAAEYEALVSLAVIVLRQAHGCKRIRRGLCFPPKRCMLPWLVRTHFGDMLRYVRKVVGEDVVADFPAHVLEVWGGDADQPIFLRFEDYLTLQEMAEVGGLIPTPIAEHALGQESHNLTLASEDEADPAGEEGEEGEDEAEESESIAHGTRSEEELLQLARDLLQHAGKVHGSVVRRPCGVYGLRPIPPATLTPRSWLDQLLRGVDIMSDADSPISRSSMSQLVFKSMGAWRMRGGEDRIYLECRTPKACLDQSTRSGLGVANQMALVAEQLQELEH